MLVPIYNISFHALAFLRCGSRAVVQPNPSDHRSGVTPAGVLAGPRQRRKGQICPFSARVLAGTIMTLVRRAAPVRERVDDAGAAAAALAPQHPRWRPAGRADSAAKGRKGRSCPFAT